MEHRWGERVAVHLTVELRCGSSPPVVGLLENLSASGAFVRTHGCRPPRGPVEVSLLRAGADGSSSVRLPAYIVRESETGIGIEWCEFAPHIVRELMARDRRAGIRVRTRALTTVRRARRASNTATQALAESAAEPAPIAATILPVESGGDPPAFATAARS